MPSETKTVGGPRSPLDTPAARGGKSGGSSRVRPLDRAREAAEFLGAYLAFKLFGLLPIDGASAAGGFLFRALGPLTRAHRNADRNIRRALPHLTDGEVRLALRGMWDNLGRTAAELPHLGLLARDTERVAIVDSDGILAELSRDGGGAVLVSAHYGNWEIASLPALRAGIVQHSVYRAPNNPAVDRLISRLRRPNLLGEFIRKGRKGLWGIVAALRAGEAVGMLVDQKLKEGVIVPFFGRDARTTDAPAALSYRFGVPIVLIKVERLRGARFRIWVSRFGAVDEKDDQDSFIEPTRQLNAILEDRVRERPDQWLWAHRRWHN